MSRFINRKKELAFLEGKYQSEKAELLILYGRRRIGKTDLALKFCEGKNFFYFMGRLESREDTLKRLNNLIIEKFQDTSLLNNPLSGLEPIFDYLAERANKRIIFVFDEFPFLVERFPEIISILQDKWDSKFKNSKGMFILLGSSIGMMERYALDYKSPLYGRRTGQWKLNKFNILHLKEFFPKYSQEELIYVYSSIDSIPGYLSIFDERKKFFENLKEKVLSKGEFLYEEIEILLREELRDPSNYMSIISAIAGGLNSFNEISQKTSLDKSMLSKYLGILESLNVIERLMPITESSKDKLKSKNSLYVIKDNFYDFWFKFVYLNKQEIEKGNNNLIERIKRDFELYISFKFENYCKEFLENLFFEKYHSFGKWWHKDKEIDIVALNEEKKEILFGECKWKDKVNALEILKELEEKSKFVDWNKEKRKESFAIFAKSFSKKIEEFNGKRVYCFDLKDF
jgi:AAA+ ATPase superfamily predicted ATPase